MAANRRLAGVAAPTYYRARVALGIRLMSGSRMPPRRMHWLLRGRRFVHSLGRYVRSAAAREAYLRLSALGWRCLTAESVVMDRPHLFDPAAVRVARRRLGR